MALIEHRRGEVRDISLEILGAARVLAGDGRVIAACLGAPGAAEELAPRCDRLVLVNDPALADYNPEPYQQVVADLVAAHAPALVLMGHTPQGLDLAPALAAAEGWPLATDVVDLAWDGDVLTGRREVYGGKLSAHFRLVRGPVVAATIRQGAFEPPAPGPGAEVAEIGPPAWSDQFARRFIGYLEAAPGEVDITQADVLISIGRGIGKPENIEIANELAGLLGGAVSCSRPVADAKWLPKDRQVGTSGRTVRPKVYLALGISGAFQHQAGMKNSGTIIAVNKDPRAPIFGVAHFGVVADLFDVVPKLIEKVRAAKG
ncbi:MAG: electron transfer flavoprotein subunit alpha/FixB family protein [Proteobacteria bacterium]|nr:electron transfer flavoprotein subunit alpha/FixB family protein [Pseudomonadota bacterium]